jgi:hypothetical protein
VRDTKAHNARVRMCVCVGAFDVVYVSTHDIWYVNVWISGYGWLHMCARGLFFFLLATEVGGMIVVRFALTVTKYVRSLQSWPEGRHLFGSIDRNQDDFE